MGSILLFSIDPFMICFAACGVRLGRFARIYEIQTIPQRMRRSCTLGGGSTGGVISVACVWRRSFSAIKAVNKAIER